jgi:hypothetical protein
MVGGENHIRSSGCTPISSANPTFQSRWLICPSSRAANRSLPAGSAHARRNVPLARFSRSSKYPMTSTMLLVSTPKNMAADTTRVTRWVKGEHPRPPVPELLVAGTSLAAAAERLWQIAPVQPAAGRGRAGEQEVAALEDLSRYLRALDDAHGGALFRRTSTPSPGSSGPATRLYAVAADLAMLAGFCSHSLCPRDLLSRLAFGKLTYLDRLWIVLGPAAVSRFRAGACRQ